MNEINFRLHRAATLTEEDTTKFPYKGPYTNMQIFQTDKKEIIALVDLILRDKSLNIKKEEINKIIEIYLKLEDKKHQANEQLLRPRMLFIINSPQMTCFNMGINLYR